MTVQDRPPRLAGAFALLLGASFVAVGSVIVRDAPAAAVFGATSVGFGLLGLGMGAYLFGVRLPLGGLMRSQPREVVGEDGTLWTAFRRPPGARVWNVVGPLVGMAISSVFVALALFSGDPEVWLFGLLGALMLVLMAIGAARGLRGLLRAEDAFRVGARGVWLPTLGVIAWSDIASVTADDAAQSLTTTHPEEPRPMNRVYRLAIGLRPGASFPDGHALDRALLGIAARSPRGPELTVFEYELGVPVADALARIERYRPSVDALRLAAEESAPDEDESRRAIEHALEVIGRDPAAPPIARSEGGPQPPA